jgi:Outer membrane protein beta-barrel domain
MKKFALAGAALAMALSAGDALAGPEKGNMGLNVDFTSSTSLLGTPSNFLIKGKYFISDDMAVLAGVGVRRNDSGAATNSTSTDLGLMGGFRKYLSHDDLSPFVGAKVQYLGVRVGTNDVTDVSLLAEAGAEYFMGKHFSLEGSLSAGYDQATAKPVAGGASVKSTTFGTSAVNVSANFYF